MRTASPPCSPPTSCLPSPPPQAPHATPRNASYLYGEFSWPSLDISTLLERLEDVAVAEEEQLQQQHQRLLPIAQIFGDVLTTRHGEENSSLDKQQAVFNEILMLLDEDCTRVDMEYRIHEWLDGVPEQVNEEDEEEYFTADDDVASTDDDFTDAISNVDDDMTNDVDANAVPWMDDEERTYMGEMNGWFDGFGGTDVRTLNQVQKRMVEVNEREGRDRRMGCVFGA
ncbi:MAG: hypothetical protein Q9221_002255 [Calogaya cf. arnoldii]